MRLDLPGDLVSLQERDVIAAAVDPAWRRADRVANLDRGAWIFLLFVVAALLAKEPAVLIAGLLFVVVWAVRLGRWKERARHASRHQAWRLGWQLPIPHWVETSETTITVAFGGVTSLLPWSIVSRLRFGGRALVFDTSIFGPVVLFARTAPEDDWNRFLESASRTVRAQGGEVVGPVESDDWGA